MKKHRICAFLAVLTLMCLGSIQAQDAPPNFESSFLNLLKNYDLEVVPSEKQQSLWREVLKYGSEDQVRAAVWSVLRDPKQSYSWGQAINLSARAGIPRNEIAEWAHNNLETVAMLPSWQFHGMISSLIITPGRSEAVQRADAERLHEIANRLPLDQEKQAKLIHQTANNIIGSLDGMRILLQQKEELLRAGQIAPSSSPEARQQPIQAQPQSKPVESKHTDKGQTRINWLLWLVVITAAIGLLWLLFKKRK